MTGRVLWILLWFLPFSGLTKPEKVWIQLREPGLAFVGHNNPKIGLYYDNYITVNEYVKEVFSKSTDILGYSVWNQEIFVLIDDYQLIKLKNGIKNVFHITENIDNEILTYNNSKITSRDSTIIQLNQASLSFQDFEQKGLSGKGITLAVFDAGFPNVDTHPAFAKLRNRGGIKATRNFLNGSQDVYKKHWHGEAVLSCLAGETENGLKLGLAGDANYLLALTEWSMREPFREEIHWQMAAEWAVQNGADIISSSLGYGSKRYRIDEMNGYYSLVGRAASQAAARGVLVVNSAGNEGSNDWKTLVTPADNDSVLCVGGYEPRTKFAIDFTSRGPSRGNRVKPNVIGPGKTLAAKGTGYGLVSGTSFSCPLIAGMAACFLQYYPELKGNPLEAIRRLEMSSDLYPYFDFAHGYGIPGIKNRDTLPEVRLEINPIQAHEILFSFSDSSSNPTSQRLFVSLLNQKKQIVRYKALDVYETNSTYRFYYDESDISFLRLFYNGQCMEVSLPETNNSSHDK